MERKFILLNMEKFISFYFRLPVLEELIINNNEITSIPISIGLLRELKVLIADENKIESLPVSIGSCSKLRILSLSQNQLQSLPDEVGRIAELAVLNLSSNRLNHLPFSFLKLTQLKALWLSKNQQKPLSNLSSEVDQVTGHKVLTCFMLPQVPDHDSGQVPSESPIARKASTRSASLHFASAATEVIGSKRSVSNLVRNPTPFPKELKAHAKHAKNLALKCKEGHEPDLIAAIDGPDVPVVSSSDVRRTNNHV